ncbi:MAG: hypothetical protein RLZZ546_942 [Bacteroidota bacterium]|jgi:DNA-nicking Smr family endonuclease
MTFYEFSRNLNNDTNEPELVIDLHGYTTFEAEEFLSEILDSNQYFFLRIIVGKGKNSENGAVLRDFVKNYLKQRRINYSYASPRNGGEGALDVFLK